jgi:hypothetical protein
MKRANFLSRLPNGKLKIFVEGPSDRQIVANILIAMGLEVDAGFDIIQCDGKHQVRRMVKNLTDNDNAIALIDADSSSVADSVQFAREYLGHPRIPVFCAVPTIEAWLFADKQLALDFAVDDDSAIAAIRRIVTPESMVEPWRLAKKAFRRNYYRGDFSFLRRMDIGRAVASSASLLSFVRGIETALGRTHAYSEAVISESLNRQVFANLLRELPHDKISWRTLEGDYSAGQLGDKILQGDEIGLRYVSDLLRLSRDILAAQALEDDKDA